MTFVLYWWLSGAVPCILAGLYLNRDGMSLQEFFIMAVGSAIFGVFGPVLLYFIVKWFWQAWQSQFAVDEGGRILYPWRD